MFPRRSTVTRVLFSLLTFCILIFLWVAGPPGGDTSVWHRLFTQSLNETALKLELHDLEVRMNFTEDHLFHSENKTLDEIYQYVLELRKQLPVNPHNFRYIINPQNVCTGLDVFLIIYIHSAPDHYKRRTSIRETWGSADNFQDHNIRLVFLVGKPADKAVQEALYMESDRYGDIVQENFLDSYRNLTYKGIMGLKWVTQHCSHAKFILKTDDDIFVNIFNVVSHLESLQKKQGGEVHHLLLCLVWYRMKVVRDSKSKWYLSKKEFKDDYFPTYCSGSAFMLTTDVASDMYDASFTTPFFWVDDFYVTGLLAKKAGVTHTKFNSVYTLGPSTFLEKFSEESKWRTLTFGHVHNINHMTVVWNKVFKDRKQSLAGAEEIVHVVSNYGNHTVRYRYIH